MIHPNEKPCLVQGKILFPVFVWLFLFLSFSLSAAVKPAQIELDFKLKSLVSHGSVLVADEKDVLYRYPTETNPLLVPASVLKLATALSALHYLGTEFRYSTDFYLAGNRKLGIRGHGDPFLVSEEWQKITQKLSQFPELPKQLNGVFFDTSLFSANIKIPGIESSKNPYDSRNGALVVNFNTVFLKIDSKGLVTSAEKQTPQTPLAKSLAHNLPPGKHRISIPPDSGIIYAGELVHAFLAQAGFSFHSGNVTLRPLSSGDSLIYTHKNSASITELIAGMMRYSNNFTANQLLLSVGLKRYGAPATLEKGTRALEEYLRDELSIPEKQFRIVEGSGISRKNRLTTEAVWQMLKAFSSQQNLLHGAKGILYKTGTLHGVSTMAGYLPGSKPRYFVILLNQPKNRRDEILKLLLATDFSG
jgi:D-alanyl-D-alanine carboxypeptidase/D-alanyl-D-alanine-endopeptidase (penicillin-binding protein 4)